MVYKRDATSDRCKVGKAFPTFISGAPLFANNLQK